MSTRPKFQPVKVSDAQLADAMNERKIPRVVAPEPPRPANTDTAATLRNGKTTAKARRRTTDPDQATPRGDLRKVAVMLPPETWRALHERALQERSAGKGCSINFLILQALKRDKWPIRDADLIDDGRKENARKKSK
jgi:hypothetical protein